jgi:uncharacterized phage-associated protein
MATAQDVAAAVVERLGTMTAMKLEKIVYYCQCWHLARTDQTMFDEPIEAWRQGPVVPALYQRHRQQYTISSWPFGDAAALSHEESATVDWVTANYGGFSAIELSRMTHNELPWRVARGELPGNARSNARLPLDIMANYYARQRADLETAITLASASSALEGVELDAEWQDRLRDLGSGVRADDLVSQEIARLNNG